MKDALRRLLSSMKTWTLLIGLTATFLAKYGIHVDDQTAQYIAGGFALLLGMQGVTDHGKAAAQITADANREAATDTSESPPTTAVMVNVDASQTERMASQPADPLQKFSPIAVLLLLLTVLPGCAWFKSEGKALAKEMVDCTTATAKNAVVQFAPVLEGYLVRAIDGNGHVDTDAVKSVAKSFAPEIGGCVIADVFARALKPAPVQAGAPAASPLTADPASLHETFEAVRVQLGGKTFHTAHGDL